MHPLEIDDLTGAKESKHAAFQAQVNVALFAVAPDGRKGVSSSGQKQDALVLWDFERESFQVLKGAVGKVECLTFSADSKRILSGSSDKIFSLWDVAGKKELKRFPGHTGAVNSVAFSPDGTRALTSSSDKTVRLWDLQTGKELLKITGHTGPVYSAVFSPDGLMALSAGTDKTVKLWRLPK